MRKPFDASLNSLIDVQPSDWANFLAERTGIPPGPVQVLDTDLSSTLQADRLFRIDGPRPAVVHLELESGGRLGIPEELLTYNVAARRVTKLPIHSVVVLLRPKATASDLTGRLELPDANGVPFLTFRYTVVRLWMESFETPLAGGPGIAPLALLTDQAALDLPHAVARFREMLQGTEVSNNVKNEIENYTRVLCGLRYNFDDLKGTLMGGRNILEDSSVYQEIFARGECRGAAKANQHTILLQGKQRFGNPIGEIEMLIRTEWDLERLERMASRMFDATGWEDLVKTD